METPLCIYAAAAVSVQQHLEPKPESFLILPYIQKVILVSNDHAEVAATLSQGFQAISSRIEHSVLPVYLSDITVMPL